MKKITKSEIGRPTSITEDVVNKLEDIIKMGGTITQACTYAKISREAYYNRYNADPLFHDKMDTAKEYLLVESKQLVHNAIIKDKDLQTAKWYLEKKELNQPQVIQQFNVENMGLNIQPLND